MYIYGHHTGHACEVLLANTIQMTYHLDLLVWHSSGIINCMWLLRISLWWVSLFRWVTLLWWIPWLCWIPWLSIPGRIRIRLSVPLYRRRIWRLCKPLLWVVLFRCLTRRFHVGWWGWSSGQWLLPRGIPILGWRNPISL